MMEKEQWLGVAGGWYQEKVIKTSYGSFCGVFVSQPASTHPSFYLPYTRIFDLDA